MVARLGSANEVVVRRTQDSRHPLKLRPGQRGGKILGSVKRQGICGGGWTVDVGDELSVIEQLMVGLISQILWKRETESSAGG